MLNIFTHAIVSCATNSTYKEVIRWIIVWQVLSLLTRFPIHYVLYWFYYYPLEYTLKAIFSGCILIYFFHYFHSWCLSLTVHKHLFWWVHFCSLSSSEILHDCLQFPHFLVMHVCMVISSTLILKLVRASKFFRSTSPFLSILLSHNVASFPVEYLLHRK